MESLFLPILLILLPILSLILKHFLSKFTSKNPLPPGPKPWPIIGNIFHMGKKPHITLANYAQSYGPLMSLKLGTQILIIGSSPSIALEILKTHDRILSARYVPRALPLRNKEANFLSMGWAFECSDQWKHLRTICRTELFSAKSIESQACLREKKTMDMIKFLSSMEGRMVNIGEVVFGTVVNVLGNVLMSRDFISLEEDSVQGELKGLLKRIVEVCTIPNLSDFYPILGGLDLQGLNKKSKELFGEIFALWEPIIRERRERKIGSDWRPKDFLDTLIENSFSNAQINQLVLELIVAGTDTSTLTIEWAMAELMKNPKPMKKIREDLTKEINKQSLNESHLSHLPYLQAIVKETLRLHPPAPFLLPHRASESCKVSNYTIPKNSQILVNVWAISRDPNVWEDPLEFKPERFLNSGLDFKGNDFEFLPFGAGRRICPGLPMAAKQVALVLAALIHFFDWSLPNGNDASDLDMSEKFGVTLQKEESLILIPKSRE